MLEMLTEQLRLEKEKEKSFISAIKTDLHNLKEAIKNAVK